MDTNTGSGHKHGQEYRVDKNTESTQTQRMETSRVDMVTCRKDTSKMDKRIVDTNTDESSDTKIVDKHTVDTNTDESVLA